jgi:hypothetical protein
LRRFARKVLPLPAYAELPADGASAVAIAHALVDLHLQHVGSLEPLLEAAVQDRPLRAGEIASMRNAAGVAPMPADDRDIRKLCALETELQGIELELGLLLNGRDSTGLLSTFAIRHYLAERYIDLGEEATRELYGLEHMLQRLNHGLSAGAHATLAAGIESSIRVVGRVRARVETVLESVVDDSRGIPRLHWRLNVSLDDWS